MSIFLEVHPEFKKFREKIIDSQMLSEFDEIIKGIDNKLNVKIDHEYWHFTHCNARRSVPIGYPGSGCCCIHTLKQQIEACFNAKK